MTPTLPIDPNLQPQPIDARTHEYLHRGRRLLDSALDKIERGSITLAMDEIVLGARKLRDEDEERWKIFVEAACRAHPIANILQEDPFTRRSLRKPRGYAGDAEMLELIFSRHEHDGDASDIGRAIFNYTTDGPAPRSVRARAAHVAKRIDELSERKSLRVLAVMAGHVWEAGLSSAVRDGQVEKYLAFDQDPLTLAFIDSADYGPGVATYQGSMRSLLGGKSVFRNFHLVYSPLLDNLPDGLAVKFISTLFGALAPGGTLMLSGFTPDLVDIGYMEAFMEWELVYRTEKEMLCLVEAAVGRQSYRRPRVYREPHGNIGFVEVVKR